MKVKKHKSSPLAMFGPLYNAEGEGGGGAAPTPPADPKPAPPAGEGEEPKAGGDEPLGEGGKKALERERDARKSLETQVSQMREAFASALGGKPDPKASTDDIVKSLQDQMSTLTRSNQIALVARENGITDPDDIALIEDAKDEDGMRRIAGRLKPDERTPGTPKPDKTQGPQGSGTKPDPGPGVARLAAAFEDELSK